VYAALRTWQYETDRIWQEQADKNADGLIGFTEVSSSDSTGVDEGTTATLNRFNFADSNKDGWLSETDIASFRNPLWFSRMHQWALGAMVLELSRDDHQNITREEYTTPDAPDMPFNWEVRVPTYVKEREFKRLDRDDSGSLDLREASQIPEVRLASIITHGVHALLHVCDEDDDGTLSVDEIVSKSTEFANAPPLATRSWEDNDGDTEHVHEDL
jgi:Ca2+-binding EF-hand superfamily protein